MPIDFSLQLVTARRPRPPENDLGFGRFFTDHMLRVDYTSERGWQQARIEPYQNLSLDPAAAVFHYGQAIFEGSKAFRGVDGRVRLFRPDAHARRFAESSRRLCMPVLPVEEMVQLLARYTQIERECVPTTPGTSLYLRPTMIGTEGFLGVRASDRYTFFTIASPVGGYFGSKGLSPLKLWVEKRFVRAAPGGLGAAKTGANYAASLLAATEAKKKGYSQVLWLDAQHHRYVEEAGTMNVFVRIGDELITPPLEGTILAGITRDSVLQLARSWGVSVSERPITIDELVEAHGKGQLREVFGTGTASVIAPVGELGMAERTLKVGDGGVGELSRRLYDEICGIQTAQRPDTLGWLVDVDQIAG